MWPPAIKHTVFIMFYWWDTSCFFFSIIFKYSFPEVFLNAINFWQWHKNGKTRRKFRHSKGRILDAMVCSKFRLTIPYFLYTMARGCRITFGHISFKNLLVVGMTAVASELRGVSCVVISAYLFQVKKKEITLHR
jgi:hypothetical protein